MGTGDPAGRRRTRVEVQPGEAEPAQLGHEPDDEAQCDDGGHGLGRGRQVEDRRPASGWARVADHSGGPRLEGGFGEASGRVCAAGPAVSRLAGS